MKKYLFWLLLIWSLNVASNLVFATLANPGNQLQLNWGSNTSNNTRSNTTNINWQPSNPAPVNPNSPNPWANTCSQFNSSDPIYASCAWCVQSKWLGTDCWQKFSCETLFTDSATANTCNFERCKVQRWATSSYCTCKYVDKWIPLNTSIPFLWNCLKKANPSDPNDIAALNAFPTIISVASRILVTIIMLAWFIMIVVWWVQWSAWNAKEWKAMIKKVAIWFALLWAMWAILRLINPNFFK